MERSCFSCMGSWYQLTQEAALRPPAGLATSLGLPLRLRAEEGRRGAGGWLGKQGEFSHQFS